MLFHPFSLKKLVTLCTHCYAVLMPAPQLLRNKICGYKALNRQPKLDLKRAISILQIDRGRLHSQMQVIPALKIRKLLYMLAND